MNDGPLETPSLSRACKKCARVLLESACSSDDCAESLATILQADCEALLPKNSLKELAEVFEKKQMGLFPELESKDTAILQGIAATPWSLTLFDSCNGAINRGSVGSEAFVELFEDFLKEKASARIRQFKEAYIAENKRFIRTNIPDTVQQRAAKLAAKRLISSKEDAVAAKRVKGSLDEGVPINGNKSSNNS